MLIQFIGDKKQSQYIGNRFHVKRGHIIEVTESQKKQLIDEFPNWWTDKPKPNAKDKTGKPIVISTKEKYKPVINSHGLLQPDAHLEF